MNTINEKGLINTYGVSNENTVTVNSTKTENEVSLDDTAAILSLSEEAFGDGVVTVKSSGARAISSTEIIATQNNLRTLGFYSGGNTGYVNTEMRNAIRNFQKVYGMAETGSLTQNVYDKVREVTIKFNTIYNSSALNNLALDSNFSLDSTQKKNFALIWTFLDKSMGLTGQQIVGAMANIMAESGFSNDNLKDVDPNNPTLHDPNYEYDATDGKAYGILQWAFLQRKQGLESVAGDMGLDESDLNAQLAYFRKEMTTYFDDLYYPDAWAHLKSTTNYIDACDVFLEEIESPETLDYEDRRNHATTIYNIMNRGGLV